jgi:hypothetical protein
MIYFVDSTFESLHANPFMNGKQYSDQWILLKVLDEANFELFTGGGVDGIFQLVVSKTCQEWPYRVMDCLQYEETWNKQIIVSMNPADLELAKKTYTGHSFREPILRPYENRVLVHSTTPEGYDAIQTDGSMKSWEVLKREGFIREQHPIGAQLGDPPDYSHYVMFSSGGVAPEIVISSKQKGRIEMNSDAAYIAGARFYFDAEKIARDGLLVRDGAHLKVRDSLPLDKYLIWVATPQVLEISRDTTPSIFSKAADDAFQDKFSMRL